MFKKNQLLHIKNVISGGVITNYYCSSQCRHCLYACSPKWSKKYLSSDIAKSILKKIKSLGCNKIHIGGGEPFLNIDKLLDVVQLAKDENVDIEYIETNSSWFNDEDNSLTKLHLIKEKGIHTLLVSISPFHNEFIPFFKVKRLIESCSKVGISVLPWISDFYTDLDYFDDQIKHSIEEYQNKFGRNYLKKIPNKYWIHFGGRAIDTFSKIFSKKSINEIINDNHGCELLKDTSHFHIDLFGNYIPGLCSGLSIQYEDLGEKLDPQKYPILTTLFSKGIKGLFELAKSEYQFEPKDKYLLKCHLCLDIRKHLVLFNNLDFIELRPIEFYENL